ncbi:polysaccharide biosynthesis protein PslA [Gammaproteobacteria bacterium]
MEPFLLSQIDYIYFAYGWSLILLFAACVSLTQEKSQPLPWMFLGMFGLTQGLSAWLNLYAFPAKGSAVWSGTQLTLLMLSFFFIWEFARVGSAAQQGRPPNRLLLAVPILVLATMTGMVIMNSFYAIEVFGYILALPACLWAAIVLKRETVASDNQHDSILLIAAGALVFYGLTVGFAVPVLWLPPAYLLRQEILVTWTGIPIVQALLAIVISVVLWRYWVQCAPLVSIAAMRTENFRRTLAMMLGVLVAGALLTNWLGLNTTQTEMYRLAGIGETLAVSLLVLANTVTVVTGMNAQFAFELARDKLGTSEIYKRKSKSIDLVLVSATVWAIDVWSTMVSGLMGAELAENLTRVHLDKLECNLSIGLAIVLYVYLANYLGVYKIVKLIRRRYVSAVITSLATQFTVLIVLAAIHAVSVVDRTIALPPLIIWLSLWGVFYTLITMVVRLGLYGLVKSWEVDGRTAQQIAIVGLEEPTQQLLDWMKGDIPDLIQIVGIFDDRSDLVKSHQELADLYRGTTDDLIMLSHDHHIDTVVLALPHQAEERLLELLFKLRPMAVQISLGPDLMGFRLPGGRARTIEMAGLPLLNIGPTPLKASQRYLKEFLDKVLASVALILLSPIILGAAIAIRLESPGPILFVQKRYGYGNQLIKVFKFRTMYTNLSDFGAARQTERNDSRITRVGNFLRKTSIDELPQFLNVLLGDMSIVGPRPLPLQMGVGDKLNGEIVAEYAHRHRLKPGLTGWAQVNGCRGAVSTEDQLKIRVVHDLYYIEHWSLWFDIRIMLMTARVLFNQENAY